MTEVVDDEVVTLKVQELLNGVDVAPPSPKPSAHRRSEGAVRVFFSYSHRDEIHLGQLKGHVRLLERQRLVQPWDDRQIRPGDDWVSEIDDNLNKADLILCLISLHFIDSDYCYNVERPDFHQGGCASG